MGHLAFTRRAGPPTKGCVDRPFLTVGSGDSFTYQCSYSNPGSNTLGVGEYATNEECLALGYYFPAGTASCN